LRHFLRSELISRQAQRRKGGWGTQGDPGQLLADTSGEDPGFRHTNCPLGESEETNQSSHFEVTAMRHVQIFAISSGLILGTALSGLGQSSGGQSGAAGGQGAGQGGQPGQTETGTPGGARTGQGISRHPNLPQAAARAPWQFGGWNQHPWFADPSVRNQLRLNNDQFDQLRSNYSQSWRRYEQGLGGLQNNLDQQQLGVRQRELGQTFQNEFNTSLDQLLADPAQRQRFGQLYLQYQGFNAFNDPTVQQRLNLTDRQLEQLSRLQQDWNQQMQVLSDNFGRDRNGLERFSQLRQEAGERIGNVLTEQQRGIWQQLIGQPYDFPPEVYFPPMESGEQRDIDQRSVPNQPNPTQPEGVR
jgi:hypothetical protein